MSADGPSFFSLAGTLVYFAVATACAVAFAHAQKFRRPSREKRFWLIALACFCMLAVMRIVGIEEGLRDLLRGVLVADGAYAERREIQGPIAAAAILVSFGILFAASGVWSVTRSRLDVALKWARMGLTAMAMLIALRLISFHPVDALLYKGPHLNWLIDLGSSLVVALASLRYARLLGLGVRPR